MSYPYRYECPHFPPCYSNFGTCYPGAKLALYRCIKCNKPVNQVFGAAGGLCKTCQYIDLQREESRIENELREVREKRSKLGTLYPGEF